MDVSFCHHHPVHLLQSKLAKLFTHDVCDMNFILDNLIGAGKAKPMIVVMEKG
jgi:hypothetical protein